METGMVAVPLLFTALSTPQPDIWVKLQVEVGKVRESPDEISKNTKLMLFPLNAEFEVNTNFTLVALTARKALPFDTGTGVPSLSVWARLLMSAQIMFELPNEVQSLMSALATETVPDNAIPKITSVIRIFVFKLRLIFSNFISYMLIPSGGACTNAQV